MKKQLLFFKAFMLLTLFANSQWIFEGNAGFSTGNSGFHDIVLDSQDTAYVAFKDYGKSDKATVMKLKGTTWDTVGVPGFTPSAINDIKIAKGLNDTIYIAYIDASTSKISVMKFNGSSWQLVGAGGLGTNTNSIDLAINSQGVIFVSFRESSQSERLQVIRYANGNWNYHGGPNVSSGTSLYPNIFITNNDTVLVAFKDISAGNKASVKKFNGTSWVNVGPAGFSSGNIIYCDIAADVSGNIFVAYADGTHGNDVTVMAYNGSIWDTVGTTQIAGTSVTNNLTLEVDQLGAPHIAFTDPASPGYGITVMKYNGTSWGSVGSRGFSPNSSIYPGLTFSSVNAPFIVFRDGTNSKPSVMSFQNTTEVTKVEKENDFTLFPNPTNSKLNIHTTEGFTFGQILNLNGKIVRHLYKNQQTIDVSDLAEGVYLVKLQTNEGMSVKKFIKE